MHRVGHKEGELAYGGVLRPGKTRAPPKDRRIMLYPRIKVMFRTVGTGSHKQVPKPSPAFGPLPEIVGPGADDSFPEPPPSVEDTAPLQKRAPISPNPPLGYSKKLCNLLPSNQQIVFHHDLSSSPIRLFTDLPAFFG